eukprot:6328181-Alexandrium_andersonii.AAC.1
MSDIGEPAQPEESSEDVGEEMMYLMNLIEEPAAAQEGRGGRRVLAAPTPASKGELGGRRVLAVPALAEAVDLARALFAAGATPGEVRVTVAEVFSLPRVTAMAERNPRLGVLSAGAVDLRPGPGGRAWDFDKAEDRDR